MNVVNTSATVSERTIEELLGWDLDKLQAIPPEDLARWVGDAVTRQEEALARMPGVRKDRTRVVGGAPSHAPKAKPDYSQLPPEMAKIAAQAAELLRTTRGKSK